MHPDFLPKKRLGQNFLFDKNILNKILTNLELAGQDTVLEIGAGLGTLTSLVAEHAKKVIALEIDKKAVIILRDKFKGYKNIKIVHQDFLKYVIPKSVMKGKIKVIGNIPYYITSPIIERLLRFRNRLDSIFLTMQKEVAERIIAMPSSSNYSALSCYLQYYTKPKILFSIKPGSFWPKPKVDSSFIKLVLRRVPLYKVKNEELFFKIIRCGFQQRRKTFINALKPVSDKEKTTCVMKHLGLDPKIRIEDLSLKELADIANRIKTI